jgi:hypothetical protein
MQSNSSKKTVSQASSHIRADCDESIKHIFVFQRIILSTRGSGRSFGRLLGPVLIKLDAALALAFFLFHSRLKQSPGLPTVLCFIAPQSLLPLTSNNLYVICSAQERSIRTRCRSRLVSLRYYIILSGTSLP